MNTNMLHFIARTSNIYSVMQSIHSFFFLFSISIIGISILAIFHFLIYGGFDLYSFLQVFLGLVLFIAIFLCYNLKDNLCLINFKNDKHNSKNKLILSIGKKFFIELHIFSFYSPSICVNYINFLVKNNNFCDIYNEFSRKDNSYLKAACFSHSTKYIYSHSYNELLLIKKIINNDKHNIYSVQPLFNIKSFENIIDERIKEELQKKINNFNQ